MSAAAATVYLGDAPPRSKHMQPVMFFGTLEVAWILPAALTHWQVGLDKHFHARKDRRLLSSIQEVRGLWKDVIYDVIERGMNWSLLRILQIIISWYPQHKP